MQIEPLPEHEWLKRLVGDWEYEAECSVGPDTEPEKGSGTESVKMLGDLWIIGEGKGTMPGAGILTAMLTIGYDPARGKFVGSWACSAMTSMFTYEGELDSDRRVLTLNTTGPGITDPSKQTNYQDIIELVDSDRRIFRSQAQDDDGAWHEFMRGVYTRIA